METSKFKERLEEEKARIETQLGKSGSESATTGDWQGATDEAPAIDPNEAADNIEELVTNTALVEELETRLREVEAALERIEAGTYGIDESTGEPINPARLEANPAARTNI